MMEPRLPNGWRFALTHELYFDQTGTCVEGVGVVPDVTTPEEVDALSHAVTPWLWGLAAAP